VTAKDTSDINEKNVGVTAAGAASVNVTDAIIHTNYDTDVTLNSATVTGKNVNINALQTQKGDGSKVGVTAVTVGALGGVGVGYAGIVNRGSTDVNITGSTIGVTKGSGEVPDTVSAENVTINALQLAVQSTCCNHFLARAHAVALLLQFFLFLLLRANHKQPHHHEDQNHHDPKTPAATLRTGFCLQ
jgi:hypothetical protein